MRDSPLPLYAIDTGIVLSIFFDEKVDARSLRAQRLLDGNRGEYELVLPAYAMVEIFAHKDVRLPGKPAGHRELAKERIDEAARLLNECRFESADLTMRAAAIARELIVDCNVRAGDAAIVASAVAAGAERLYSWDERLIRATQMSYPGFVRLPPPADDLFGAALES